MLEIREIDARTEKNCPKSTDEAQMQSELVGDSPLDIPQCLTRTTK